VHATVEAEPREETHMKRRGAVVAIALGLAVMLTSCGGGGATVQTGNTTLGQELQDLKASYDKGIITEKEYNETKKRLIEKRTE
jgi:hypothetical protein